MSTELAVWTPPPPPTKDEWETIRNMGISLAKSDIVPKHFQGKPENVIVAILTGRGIGIDWMLAVQRGYVIDGKFALEAEVMADVVRRNLPGFDFEVVALSDEKCILKGGVEGKNVHIVEFTYAMAKLAGYTEGKYGEKDNWKPGRRADSLYAKALRRLIKRTGGYYAVGGGLAVVRDADESDDPDVPPVKHEPSTAAVVDEPAKPAAPAPEPKKDAPVHVEVAAVDWQHRLMCAVAAFYGHTAMPPMKQPGRANWAKKHADLLLKAVNHFYESRGEKPISAWSMFPPMDFEFAAVWVEEYNAKKGAGSGGQESPVAQDAPPAPEEEPTAEPADPVGMVGAAVPGEQASIGFDDAPPPPEDAPPAPPTLAEQTDALSQGTIEDLCRVLDTLKFAFKGARRFYERDPKSGRLFLRDGEVLSELGYSKDVNGTKAPVSQWLDTLWLKDADRIMLSRLVVELLNKENVR